MTGFGDNGNDCSVMCCSSLMVTHLSVVEVQSMSLLLLTLLKPSELGLLHQRTTRTYVPGQTKTFWYSLVIYNSHSLPTGLAVGSEQLVDSVEAG